MKQYLDLVNHVLEHVNEKGDRTETDKKSDVGNEMRFDWRDGCPLVQETKIQSK